MDNGILIGTSVQLCPVCGMPHPVEERVRRAEADICGVHFWYEERFFFCGRIKNEFSGVFMSMDMLSENRLSEKNAYRNIKGLPPSHWAEPSRNSWLQGD